MRTRKLEILETLIKFMAFCAAGIGCVGISAAAEPTAPAQIPLFLTASAQPAVLLNMGRDHKLYYEAYNDASDINGDGIIDVRYSPETIDYFGLFDSFKCYTYFGGKFLPSNTTENKKCSGKWSGDFLNYLTTTRIDAVRKVLYGGKRFVDSATETVLERNYIPQDAHSFGKEYVSEAVSGYKISDYAPLENPSGDNNILFASVTLLNSGSGEPLLRVLTGKKFRVWEWLSIERPVAGDEVADNTNTRTNVASSIKDYVVRVRVCVDNLLEQDCRGYPVGSPTVSKPTGVLHEFGENDQMRFGLMSGSYDRNMAGGVLRKNISNFGDEINPETGQFTNVDGIVKTIDSFRVQGFGGNYQYDCGWPGDNKGPCGDWGNPIAEMMYEGLRYLSGKNTPTPEYNEGSGTSPGPKDLSLGLPKANWVDPYGAGGLPRCSKPVQMVISDIYPSADGDEIPGGFGGFSGDLAGFSANTVANLISSAEGIPSGASKYFIGQSGFNATGDNNDGAPTPKTITGFGNIRGIAPEEPSRGGTYYSAAVAAFGKTRDIRPDLAGVQNVDSYSIALASPLPKIQIPTANGGLVTLIPLGRTVNETVPIANQIVDFYIDSIVNQPGFPTNAAVNNGRPAGKFRINFEDVDQGADHDMDAIVEYKYELTSSNKVKITLTSGYAAGGKVQHMGYVISGTTEDGSYLRVRDSDTSESELYQYGLSPVPTWFSTNVNKTGSLPLTDTREFTPNARATDDAKFIPNGPLWYAAKWGGFPDVRNKDTNEVELLAGMSLPAANSSARADESRKWDRRKAGEPDNYFLVNDASLLREQMRRAFLDIQQRSGAAAGVANGSVGLSADSWSYTGTFDSTDWSGRVTGARISTTGVLSPIAWTTDKTFEFPNTTWQDRTLLTWSPAGTNGIEGSAKLFNATGTLSIPTTHYGTLNLNKLYSTLQPIASLNWNTLTTAEAKKAKAMEVMERYLKGDRSMEKSKSGGNLRNRTFLMGDIVNSNIVASGNFNYGFRTLPKTEGTSYAAWLSEKRASGANYRTVFVGANDGMLHAINATTGEERFAYVPFGVYPKLYKLLESGSPHEYMVDGKLAISDAYRGGRWTTVVVGSTGAGGRSVFALDVGSPTGAPSNVMWEFRNADLGYPLGKPIIGRTANAGDTAGKWVAVFANGYFSNSGRATLFVVDLFTGETLEKINFDATVTTISKNGLGAPGAWVEDGILKAVFAGDLKGNLWGVNFGAGGASNWKKIGGTSPVFVAKDADGLRQPISSPPAVYPFIAGGVQILFGTGKLVVDDDRSNSQRQSFYSLQETDLSTKEREVQRDALLPTTLTENGNIRYLSKITFTGRQKGWYFDLPQSVQGQGSERFVAEAKLSLGYIDVNTWKPLEDRCAVGGQSWGMTANALTGSVGEAQLDTNGDGYVDSWEGKSGDIYAAGLLHKGGGTISAPAINITPGGATGAGSASVVSSTAGCKPGENEVTIPGSPGVKLCRPPRGTEAQGCEPGSKMRTNASNSSTKSNTTCVKIPAGRQTWTQLR
jgi:type IV pilus assembly protein PilY1